MSLQVSKGEIILHIFYCKCLNCIFLCLNVYSVSTMAELKTNTSKPCSGFECKNHAGCIPRAKRCDQQTDCADGSDEAGCGK